MALRHNIKDNPQLLGLAKSKVAQLRSTMGKKTKHLSQIINTSAGKMKLRIAGEHEYAYQLSSSSPWLLVAKFDNRPEQNDGTDWATKNKLYAQVDYDEIHRIYLKVKDPSRIEFYPEDIDPSGFLVKNWQRFIMLSNAELFSVGNIAQVIFFDESVHGDNIMVIEYLGVWTNTQYADVYIDKRFFLPLPRPFLGLNKYWP